MSTPLNSAVFSREPSTDLDDGYFIGQTEDETRHVKEHPFMNIIRGGISKYRLKSPSHFAVSVEVRQESYRPAPFPDSSKSVTIKVIFETWGKELTQICKPRLRKGKPTNSVLVGHGHRFVSLNSFLDKHFCIPTLDDEAMLDWWNANGKTFHWSKLPNELKENVIQFCLFPRGFGGYLNDLQTNSRYTKKPKIYEITDMLGKSKALLSVSQQVRAITIRLCNKWLFVIAPSYHDFETSLKRLGRCYQMTEPYSIPVDKGSMELAKQYQNFPKLHPQLGRYATFRHGIRNIILQMNFPSSLQFFKVTAHGFERYWCPRYTTYTIFEQLPNLKGLLIKLPSQPKRWKDTPFQKGPLLFHHDNPCPRALHRLIYERIAEVMVPFQGDLIVQNFMDLQEERRYLTLCGVEDGDLESAQEENNDQTTEDAESVGLDEAATTWSEDQSQDAITSDSNPTENGFFPPQCRCKVQCIRAFRV